MDRWIEYHLHNVEKPKVMYEYYVTGRGGFPFDMLRYDLAWPASGDDAAKLVIDDRSREFRSIKMRSYKEPTVDRWSSFLWSVGNESFERATT